LNETYEKASQMSDRAQESLQYAIWLDRRIFAPRMHLMQTGHFNANGYYPRWYLPFL